MSGTIPYCTPLSRTVPLSDGPFVTGVLKNSTDTVYLKPEQCSGEGCYLKKGQCVFQIPNHEVTSKTSRGVIGVGSNYPLRPLIGRQLRCLPINGLCFVNPSELQFQLFKFSVAASIGDTKFIKQIKMLILR